ncbi:MAG TPA: cyclopropane-fatty-acyl-phospholipid synthase family protein [Acetobacteraceae bacterium]|nr:cyclopropane-fatty-acyl-phospholipid synthase family protein [Acetobacteraceae bacterium]
MRTLLDAVFRRFVVIGRLKVEWPDGRLTTYAGKPGPEATIKLRGDRIVRRLLFNPALAVGEGYMGGGVEPRDCTIYDVLAVAAVNTATQVSGHPAMAMRAFLDRQIRLLAQFNPAGRARRNVAHHYDLHGRTYSLFLDRDRQYSCAYFPRGNETLEEAQVAKKRHIASKLMLNRPDLRILDIGCGWGGMALMLAREYGARVTGITLSTEQLAEARSRATAEGLSDRVSFELLDYRSIRREFDRIVSVGMFEHVGIAHYRTFFDVVKRCLAPDGVALIHAIGRADGPGTTNPWLTKYIFPGGYSPALSEVFAAVEKTGLFVTDVEILRLHYAETLRHWRRRFAANRDAIAAMHDERFCRMFEFYLAGSELAFRHQGHMIWQMQITRDQAAVPLTRDYMLEAERSAGARVRADAD